MTYCYNHGKENILQSDYPKLILNNNNYSNEDIPHILKDVFNIDKPIFENMEKEDMKLLESKLYSDVLKKWTTIQNKIFFELEKLFYVFINFYIPSKKNLLVKAFKGLINLIYSPSSRIKTYFINKKSLNDYMLAYKISNIMDCLSIIFTIFDAIDNFLKEIADKIGELQLINDRIKQFLDQKILSYHLCVYSVYQIFRDFFNNEKDLDFLKTGLKDKYPEKLERYEKDHEHFFLHVSNTTTTTTERNYFNNLDFVKYKNCNISEDVRC